MTMSPMMRAVAVAAIQVLIVSSLGAKLLYDRHTRPQVWMKTARYDPNLPIRGRYLALQAEVLDPRTPEEIAAKFGKPPDQNWISYAPECGSIEVRDGAAVAVFNDDPAWNCDNLGFSRWRTANGPMHLRIDEQLLFFIPDTVKDPRGSTATGEEMWVLATIPRKGPPRPIRLGIKKPGAATIEPLPLQ
jgi:hypothetical protein